MWSCSEPITVDYSSQIPLLLECELSPSRRIEARVYELSDFNDINSKGEVLENMIIHLGTNTDEALAFEYDPRNKVYFIDSRYHVPSSKFLYTIKAYKYRDAVDPIEAKTQVPSPQVFKKVGDAKFSEVFDAKRGNLKEVKVNVSLPSTGQTQYFLST